MLSILIEIASERQIKSAFNKKKILKRENYEYLKLTLIKDHVQCFVFRVYMYAKLQVNYCIKGHVLVTIHV